jgi:hypothetical protein
VEYDDILALTLPRNMRYLSRCLVVTSPEDERTAAVVRGMPGVDLLRTDAFTRDGADFNKGLALNEAFDALGHSGWILLIDADILLPETFVPWQLNRLEELDREVIYGIPRRRLPDGDADIELDWTLRPPLEDIPCAGYFQLFHAGADGLKSRPWYSPDIIHAGISDAIFGAKFAARVMLNGCVLHVGATFENWFGRATPRLDGLPVPESHRRRVQAGELFLDGWGRLRPDLQSLALEERRSTGKG